MSDNKEALPVVQRDDTEHGVEYCLLSDATAAISELRAQLEFTEHKLSEELADIERTRNDAALLVAELRAEVERQRIKLAHDVEPFSVDQLLRRVVMNAASRHRASSGPFWVRIKELTALGSNCSAGLARWAGFDPDTGARSAASGESAEG